MSTIFDSVEMDPIVVLGRVFAPAFVKKERELEEECKRWGAKYEPPSDVENLSKPPSSEQLRDQDVC